MKEHKLGSRGVRGRSCWPGPSASPQIRIQSKHHSRTSTHRREGGRGGGVVTGCNCGQGQGLCGFSVARRPLQAVTNLIPQRGRG